MPFNPLSKGKGAANNKSKPFVIGLGVFLALIAGLLLFIGEENVAEAQSVDAPTGLTTTGTTINSISLSWNPVRGADSYRIEWSRNSGTYNLTDSRVTLSTNATITPLLPNTLYYFRVRSAVGRTFGIPSAEIEARTGHNADGWLYETDPSPSTTMGIDSRSANDVTLSSRGPITYWNEEFGESRANPITIRFNRGTTVALTTTVHTFPIGCDRSYAPFMQVRITEASVPSHANVPQSDSTGQALSINQLARSYSNMELTDNLGNTISVDLDEFIGIPRSGQCNVPSSTPETVASGDFTRRVLQYSTRGAHPGLH